MVDSSAPLVLDISSDDDDYLLGSIGTIDSDNDWLSDLFPVQDERDDEDDVVVLSEVFANPKKKAKKEEVEEKLVVYDDVDDDDCVILEGDPEKPGKVEHVDSRDSEDLLIVGEKGEVACRDFPHARHLCAKFPFASTPHEQHCCQCHCYVCDSVAPCIYWGNGNSTTDHCHSNDKDLLWKAQRKSFRKGNSAPLPRLLLSDTSLSMPPPQAIPVQFSTSAQNQMTRLSGIHSRTKPTNSGISNLTHQQRSHMPLHTPQRSKFTSSLGSQQLLNSCNSNSNHIVGRLTPSNLGAQYLNRPKIFKRPNVIRPNSRSVGMTNNNHVSQNPRNSSPFANLSCRSLTYQQVTGSQPQQNYGGSSRGSLPPSQAQVNGINSFVGSVPCQPQASNNHFGSVTSGQSSLQTNVGGTFVIPVPPHLQAISQADTNCFQNQVLSQSQILPESELYIPPNMGMNNIENAVPYQSQSFSQPNICGGDSINPEHSESQLFFQPNYPQEGNENKCDTNIRSTYDLTSLVGPTDQYNLKDGFLAENPARSHQTSSEPKYDSSIIPENTDNSYYWEPDTWLGGYIGDDGFALGSSEAANVNTDPLFDYAAFD